MSASKFVSRMKRSMTVSYGAFRAVAFAYMLLPCLVFALFYVKLAVGIPLALAIAACYFMGALRRGRISEGQGSRALRITATTAVLIVGIVLIWTFLSGQGGYWYQSTDWDARNAIFRDLITHPWPVIYEGKGTAFAYYMSHWMVPAAAARGVYLVAGLRLAWLVGRLLLWAWTALGLVLVICSVMMVLRERRPARQMLVVLMFVFFSGMDIVGAAVHLTIPHVFSADVLHLEWWFPMQFSSITTCLFWVFNQAVIPWLATACFLLERNCSNYVMLGVAALFAGPFPALGLAFLMVVRFLCALVANASRSHRHGRGWGLGAFLLENVATPQNLVMLVLVAPVFLTYFMSNGAFTGGAVPTGAAASEQLPLADILLMLFVDMGAFALLLCRENRRNPMFWAVVALLAVCPFVKVGGGYDFTMRVSIPGILILALLCIRMVLSNPEGRSFGFKCRRIALIACLILGTATPFLEIYRGYYHVRQEGHAKLVADWTQSFDYVEPSMNFESFDYESTLFHRLFE